MNKSTSSNLNSLRSSQDRKKDTIGYRVQFIEELLKNKELKPLINFTDTDCNTEYFKYGKHDDDTELPPDIKSNDTRYLLHKRIYNFQKIISKIGGKLYYVKSGANGHTFKGIIDDNEEDPFNYAVKVVAYPKKSKYNYIYDPERPENAEIMMIRLLSYFIINKQTPHIVLPITTFNTSITPFLTLLGEEVVDETDEKYLEFLENYKAGYFHDEVSILISEWANKGDLLEFIRNYYKKLKLIHWKVFFFQIISTLAVIQSKFPAFRHNDLKANNILIHKIQMRSSFLYQVLRKKYSVPNVGYSLKLWDFDFACIPGIVNNSKVASEWSQINVTPEKNCYYDIHYFFNTLAFTGFFSKFMTANEIPKEVKDFVKRVIPAKYRTVSCVHIKEEKGTNKKKRQPSPKCEQCHKYVHKRGRLLVNDEYVSPAELLNDPFFHEFSTNKQS